MRFKYEGRPAPAGTNQVMYLDFQNHFLLQPWISCSRQRASLFPLRLKAFHASGRTVNSVQQTDKNRFVSQL